MLGARNRESAASRIIIWLGCWRIVRAREQVANQIQSQLVCVIWFIRAASRPLSGRSPYDSACLTITTPHHLPFGPGLALSQARAASTNMATASTSRAKFGARFGSNSRDIPEFLLVSLNMGLTAQMYHAKNPRTWENRLIKVINLVKIYRPAILCLCELGDCEVGLDPKNLEERIKDLARRQRPEVFLNDYEMVFNGPYGILCRVADGTVIEVVKHAWQYTGTGPDRWRRAFACHLRITLNEARFLLNLVIGHCVASGRQSLGPLLNFGHGPDRLHGGRNRTATLKTKNDYLQACLRMAERGLDGVPTKVDAWFVVGDFNMPSARAAMTIAEQFEAGSHFHQPRSSQANKGHDPGKDCIFVKGRLVRRAHDSKMETNENFYTDHFPVCGYYASPLTPTPPRPLPEEEAEPHLRVADSIMAMAQRVSEAALARQANGEEEQANEEEEKAKETEDEKDEGDFDFEEQSSPPLRSRRAAPPTTEPPKTEPPSSSSRSGRAEFDL